MQPGLRYHDQKTELHCADSRKTLKDFQRGSKRNVVESGSGVLGRESACVGAPPWPIPLTPQPRLLHSSPGALASSHNGFLSLK